MKFLGRNVVKCLVDHAAVFLTVAGVVLILFGIFGIIMVSGVPNYEYQAFRSNNVNILMGGISALAGGLFLLIGIFKAEKVFFLIHLGLSTPAITAATVYILYVVILSYNAFPLSSFLMLFIIFLFMLTFTWLTQWCIFLFYKELAGNNGSGVVQRRVHGKGPTEAVLFLYHQN